MLQERFRDFLQAPVVTVFLRSSTGAALRAGEVARPGVYPLERGQGVLRAVAAAGGFTEFAHKDRIFLVRAGTRAASGSRSSNSRNPGAGAPGSGCRATTCDRAVRRAP